MEKHGRQRLPGSDHAERHAHAVHARCPGLARDSSTSTTTDGRIFSSAAETCCPAPMPDTTVDQHNTVFRNPGATGGANGRWQALTAEAGLDASAGGATSRAGIRRSRWRWHESMRGDHIARAPGRNLDESQPWRQVTGWTSRWKEPRATATASARAFKVTTKKRIAVQPHDHQRGLRVIQLRTRAFRVGH